MSLNTYIAMIDMPLISIIIPVFNAEIFLENNITILLNNSFKQFELILINDGSTDKSGEIVDAFAKKDNRIVVFNQPNLGVAKSRNIGLQMAHGEYLLFWDADDQYESDSLKLIVNALERNSFPDILFWKYRINDKNSNMFYGMPKLEDTNLEHTNFANPKLAYNVISSPVLFNKIFKRCFINKYELWFQDLETCNDAAFVWLAIEFAQSIYYLGHAFYTYNHKNAATISQMRHIYSTNIVRAGEHARKYLIQNGKALERLYDSIIDNMAYERSQFPDSALAQYFDLELRYFLDDKYYKKYLQIISYNTGDKYKPGHLGDPDPEHSYIILSENAEQSIKRFLDDVLKFNKIQIICVDNGSTDNTPCIIREYAVRYFNLIALTEKKQDKGYLLKQASYLAESVNKKYYFINNFAVNELSVKDS